VGKATIVYIRESTDRQDLSPMVQAEKAAAYCSLRELDVLETLHDRATSAGKPFQQRPAAARVRDMVESGVVECIVALKLDRMFRDAVDCLTNVDVWDRHNVALHLLDMGGSAVDSRSAAGRFMLTVLAAAAEMERNRIGERTRDALRLKKGRREVYGPVPYGFTREGVKLLISEPEQEVIAQMRSLRGAGASFHSIADALNRQRIRPKRGRLWYASSVRSVLLNEIHDG
jgi:DNA invertase Pin-like site-specific DNA recombinase